MGVESRLVDCHLTLEKPQTGSQSLGSSKDTDYSFLCMLIWSDDKMGIRNKQRRNSNF